jgi:hypothetical protein
MGKLRIDEIVPPCDVLHEEMANVKGGTSDTKICFKGCSNGGTSTKGTKDDTVNGNQSK